MLPRPVLKKTIRTLLKHQPTSSQHTIDDINSDVFRVMVGTYNFDKKTNFQKRGLKNYSNILNYVKIPE